MQVLHVVENLDRGSVENWLLRMMSHGRHRGLDLNWSFYCTLNTPGVLDSAALGLGARIVRSPIPIGQKLAFATALRAELKVRRYDVIHCHHDLISGLYLISAVGLKPLRRIVHVHNADEQVLTGNAVKETVYRSLLRGICLGLADKIVGNSNHSLDRFLAGRPRIKGRDVVHYLGVDPRPFATSQFGRIEFRRSLGLPEDSLLMLFAGRMVPEKNPLFAVDVIAELRRKVPRAVGVFVGSGSLQEAVRQRARDLGQSDAIRVLGWRGDVPDVMSACDWFILPHPENPVEAFGIAVVEAQLGGLRLLLSRGILDDPLLPTALYERLPLSAGPEVWAKAALELLGRPNVPRRDIEAAFGASPMDMDFALNDLLALYQ